MEQEAVAKEKAVKRFLRVFRCRVKSQETKGCFLSLSRSLSLSRRDRERTRAVDGTSRVI